MHTHLEFLMKGVKIIDSAINIFEKVNNRLNKGIEVSTKEIGKLRDKIGKHNEKIGYHETDILTLNATIERANKVRKNLENIMEK